MSPVTAPEPHERWAKALRTLVTPGVYGADLKESPLLDHPAVLARAGEGAGRQVRAEALIDVLEKVVETRLRANDRIAARMLLGLGEWSGRPVTERHQAVARLRNRHWTWERNYRKEPLGRDLLMIVLALDRAVPGPDDKPGPPETRLLESAPGRAEVLSGDLVRDLGRRRTAYPLDMSLHQLHDGGLLVGTRMVRYHERGRSSQMLALDTVMRALAGGRSVLLLGEPGSGKSVALYEAVQRSLAEGLLPFAVRAREHARLLSGADWPWLKVLPGAVIFLDGLDEAVADAESLARTLPELLRARPTLVTSRLRAYEQELSPLLADAGFDEVYVLLPWRPGVEFRDFLDRLHSADLLDRPERLHDAVTARQDLSQLAARPLYARMLTFIGEHARFVEDPVTLYDEYLSALAKVADSSAGHQAAGSVDALTVWQAAAWAAHASGAMARGAMPVAELVEALVEALPPGIGPQSLRRMLDLILDIRTVRNREVGEFLHYSFFEYLVAAHVCDALLDRPNVRSIHELFRRDLTREMRHCLLAQLRATPQRDLREGLAAAYREAGSAGTTPEGQAVRNLLVYLLSRSVPHSDAVLSELLEAEDDPFLAAAILWALCHRDVPGSDRRFFARLDQDPSFRSMCRGYVLYYYGDLEFSDGPPYLDNPPYRSCANTLRTILELFERSTGIQDVSARRRGIDLYTFLDILVVRDITLPTGSLDLLEIFHRNLQGGDIDATLWARLAEMMEMLRAR
ncbi:NACHT domain-containing protein [Actinomadura fibrosa]|uniref:NACHT domain-containing protein n=1 Tax=Actinomadura fibrosa TaxID=111802 RepID=A0ABW2XCY8_9ACTN|nr:ATP-binding protein [Actinomadura fibrosa]